MLTLRKGAGTDTDPRVVPDLQIGVSAKIYHDDGKNTFEVYPEVVTQILQNASTAPGS